MKKKMNKVFVVCLAATAMTAGMSVSAFAQVHIGETTYKTFDEAVAAAADGAVIVLDTDETTSGLNLSKNLTVDGHDKRMNDCLPPILFSAIFKLLKVLPDTELDAC